MTWLRRNDLILLNGSLEKDFYEFVQKNNNYLKPIPLESGDEFDINTEEAVINSNLIKSKTEILLKADKLKKIDKIKNQINKINEIEKSFKINPKKLLGYALRKILRRR